MRQKSVHPESPSERLVKNIRRATRKRHSPEEKIRIVLDGLRGESSIAELCRREGLQPCPFMSLGIKHPRSGGARFYCGTIDCLGPKMPVPSVPKPAQHWWHRSRVDGLGSTRSLLIQTLRQKASQRESDAARAKSTKRSRLHSSPPTSSKRPSKARSLTVWGSPDCSTFRPIGRASAKRLGSPPNNNSIEPVSAAAKRERCSPRKINKTISLAFLAPDLVKGGDRRQAPRRHGGRTAVRSSGRMVTPAPSARPRCSIATISNRSLQPLSLFPGNGI